MRDLMSLETVTALPLGARITCIPSDGIPSVREMPLRGLVVSLTRATSPSLTGTPVRPGGTGLAEAAEGLDPAGPVAPAGDEGDWSPTTKPRRSSAVRKEPSTSTGSVV